MSPRTEALAADLVGAAHDDVGAGVGRGEGLAEVGALGVADDERRGEERDAEDDGRDRPEQAPLARPEPGEDGAQHLSFRTA